jgi:hypothetical protein
MRIFSLLALLFFCSPVFSQVVSLQPGDSLTAVMSGAPAATNPTYLTRAEFQQKAGSFNGATAVTLASDPVNRATQVSSVRVYNADTASVTITFTLDSASDVVLGKITLPSLSTLDWDDRGMRVIDSSGQLQQGSTAIGGTGAANGTGVAAAESGQGPLHFTTLTLTNTPVVLADNAGVIAYGSLKIYDMPEGAIQFLGAVTDLDLTLSAAGVNADWDGDIGLGSVAANNSATLATTEQNIIPTTATPEAATSATTGNSQSTLTEAGTVLNGTSTAVDVYLNLLVDDDDHNVTGTATNIICNGTVKLVWVQLGDY